MNEQQRKEVHNLVDHKLGIKEKIKPEVKDEALEEIALCRLYELVREKENEINREYKEYQFGIICSLRIPKTLFNRLKDINKDSNLDGILDGFWYDFSDNCIDEYSVYTIKNPITKHYEFVVDIDFSGTYIRNHINEKQTDQKIERLRK
jgi:hypothetical protein